MNKIFIIFALLLGGCANAALAQQVQVSRDVLPNTDSTDSTAVLNNVLRQNQNAINSIGGYFNNNGYLGPANGGTGTNISAFPNGSLLTYNSSNVGIGTFAQGNAGQILFSQGAALPPIFGDAIHAVQTFTASGTFTAPANVTQVYISEIAGGGGAGGSSNGGSTGGGGSATYILNHPYIVVPLNNYTVTIGAGGAGGASSGSPSGGIAGADGGTTTFDTLSVIGGKGGSPSHVSSGAPGAAVANAFTPSTTAGGLSYFGSFAGGTRPDGTNGGGGAGSPFGSGGAGGGAGVSGSNALNNSGAGGGGDGSSGAGTKGGDGGSGIVFIIY